MSQQKGQFTDEHIDEFKTFMTKEIEGRMRDKEFEDTANQMGKVVNVAMDKLEEMNVKGFKYAVDFIVMPESAAYRRNTSFWWAKQTDRCIKVNIECDYVRGYLVVYVMRQ